MKFLPEEKNKQLILTVVLLLSVGGIVYLNFFARKPGAAPVPTLPPAEATAIPPAQNLTNNITTVKRAQAGLLPYGQNIDLNVLDSEKFKSLKAAPALEVKPEELGKTNLFQ